ncbi:hypothetical protein GCM10007170_13840 [Arthrobacter liuii]|uniref:Uncharacterized protein n=1 Tax=Arthrobacter liuii TaxID=1476996 RepID=A0ABQ2AKW7_9MICC|nr:hypothetical protein GCM10007170_13840 [Arthrobacter liuii]
MSAKGAAEGGAGVVLAVAEGAPAGGADGGTWLGEAEQEARAKADRARRRGKDLAGL